LHHTNKKAAFTISHKGCFSMQVIFKKILYRVCADVLYQLYNFATPSKVWQFIPHMNEGGIFATIS